MYRCEYREGYSMLSLAAYCKNEEMTFKNLLMMYIIIDAVKVFYHL